MRPVPALLNLLPTIPVLLAHLAGMVAATILLVRQQGKRAAATLALIGFGLLVILDLANSAQGPLIRLLSRQTATGVRLAHISVICCCSLLDVAAIVCLIVAIWQAMSSAGRKERDG
ncbi:MAG: hypothetical protein PVH80_00455 [Anaerolineae bacterium]|jgi:predicted acyltransferase